MERHFGPGREDRARYGYERGIYFELGGSVLFDEKRFRVELSGSALGLVDGRTRLEWARELMGLGVSRWSRVDVAVDYRGGTGAELLEHVRESCKRGELCRGRRWTPVAAHRGREVIGETVYLGKRGKFGSGRMVRVYDKGLEQRSNPRGEWVRWEAELRDTRGGDWATQTVLSGIKAMELADGHKPDAWEQGSLAALGTVAEWERELLRIALSAFEFRQVNGQSKLDRRPLVAWYARLLAAVGGKPRPLAAKRRPAPTFEGFRRWLKRSVAPTIALMARLTNQTGGDVLAEVCGELGDVRPAGLGGNGRAFGYAMEHYFGSIPDAVRALLRVGRSPDPPGAGELAACW